MDKVLLLIMIWLPGDTPDRPSHERFNDFDTMEQCEAAARDFQPEAKAITDLGGRVAWHCFRPTHYESLSS